jgi:hypothetical protein
MVAESSLALCLFDFVPNAAFLVGVWFLLQIRRLTGDRRSTVLLASGGILVFAGGLLKAAWKLMCTIGLPDVRVLSEAQFVLMATGFALFFLGLLPWVSETKSLHKQDRGLGIAAVAAWKVPLLVTMTVCSIGSYGILAYVAWKRRATVTAILFGFAMVGLLLMSGMARMEQTITQQWIQEGVNSVGQICFAGGSYTLYESSRQRQREEVRVA